MRVVVLGAGIIGTAVAEALATRGAQVVVLDMRGPGRGASQASAGMIAPYVEGRHHHALLSLAVRSAAMFGGFVARLAEASGMPIEYARTGTLEVALSAAGAEELTAARAWLDSQHVPAEWLEGGALHAREPELTPNAVGGLHISGHGFVRVPALVAALVQSAKTAGAVYEAPIEAAAVHHDRERAEVRAGDRRYTADAVVIATGAWSRRVRVSNVAALPVRPVRGQLLQATWPAPARLAQIVWGPRCYVVPLAGGSVLVGATVEEAGFDEHATLAGVNELTTAVSDLLPGAGRARLDEVRVGLRPALPDGLPAIGPLSRAPRVIVATGHHRNGVLLAPVTAEIVTKCILDGQLDETVLLTTPD